MLMVPFDVGTLLANANVLRKFGLTRSTGEGRVFSFTSLRERDKEPTKVKRSRVSGSNCPSDSKRAGRVDLSRRWVDGQGRDEGKGEEKCAATVRSISPDSSMACTLSRVSCELT